MVHQSFDQSRMNLSLEIFKEKVDYPITRIIDYVT